MRVPVGPFWYTVDLSTKFPVVDGQPALGCCSPRNQTITVYKHMRPQKRVSVFWHELLHAWRAELDIHHGAGAGVGMNEESAANLIGLAMLAMSPKMLAQLHVFLATGAECDDVLLIRDCDHPIPVYYQAPLPKTDPGGSAYL